EAIKDYDKAIELNPNNEMAYINRGFAKSDLKMYEESIDDYTKVIELNPNNEMAYINRGLAKSDLKMYEESIEDYDKAIELDPNNSEAYLNRGISKSNLKRYKEVIEDYNKVIELDPNNSEAYLNRGASKGYLKEYESSINDFNKAIELNPNDEHIYFNRAISKFNLERYEESIEDYDKAIKLNLNYIDAYINRGISKLNLDEYKEAIEDFNKAIELDPDYAEAYFCRGYSKAILKKYKESIDDYNKVIEINKDYKNAYINRGISKLNLDEYKEAIKDFNKVIEINKDDKDAYFLIGICKIYLENENAIEDFRNFFKINKNYNIYIITILQKFDEYDNIEILFKFIVDIKNNELWRNEPITNLISLFDESKNFDDKLKENIKYLLLYEYFLLKILTFDTKEKNNNIEISHYTSLDILTLLLNPKEEKTDKKENTKESGNIRINNITTANDPKEGKILERILNKNNIDIKIENDEKALTLQTSYSRNKDSLTMFRLYGKKENKEATGICLVLDNKYFNNSYTSPYSYEFKLKIENNKIEMNEKINKEKFQENKRNLYWVLYYNEKENQLIYNKEKSKYASNIIDLNDLNNDDYKAELKEDDKKEDMIKYSFAKIFYYTKEIKKQIEDPKNNEIYKNIKSQLYSYLFENIKYIIKHEAFFEEQELRMLVTNDYKSDEILIDNDNKKLYIDYIKLFDEKSNYIKEIIIGSKVENNEAVAEYIRKVLHSKNIEMNKLDDIKVSISEAPLR
ncbi:tetratricopeptide repeat protein, partial [Brachyspira hyodysenteriae]|uniref:tetratricopeptide repeat protein n=1 Tax=Brachyspira hyodysenteriae TaxID=159 RepID=UPI00063DC895